MSKRIKITDILIIITVFAVVLLLFAIQLKGDISCLYTNF